MDRRTLVFLAAGVAVLMVILIGVGVSGGLPGSTRALVQAEATTLERHERDFDRWRQEILTALANEPDLFAPGGYDEAWKKRLAAARTQFAQAHSELEAAREGLKTDDPEKRVEIESHAQKARAIGQEAVAEVARIREQALERVRIKREFAKSVEEIQSMHRRIQTADITALTSEVARATTDWPEKKSDLESRLARVAGAVRQGEEAWKASQEAGATPGADSSKVDFDKVIAAKRALQAADQTLSVDSSKIKALIAQLYVSWDKVLADMEIKEGADVTFHHKIKVITTPVAPADSTTESAVAPQESETWKTVDKARYLAMEKNLGMVIEHKDPGKYDSEAVSTIQPPGYAYIAPPGQSNRYGRWENRGGSNFWVFYGQYALMRNLLWGSSYDPVPVSTYRNYDDARRSGRAWYGSDATGKPRYGSSGTYTTSRYKSSRYTSNDGFKSTQFKRSGGTYRGSRYASRSSTGSSGGFSTSRYRTGTSSFGSRSSSSRSSFGGSRFGGGK